MSIYKAHPGPVPFREAAVWPVPVREAAVWPVPVREAAVWPVPFREAAVSSTWEGVGNTTESRSQLDKGSDGSLESFSTLGERLVAGDFFESGTTEKTQHITLLKMGRY